MQANTQEKQPIDEESEIRERLKILIYDLEPSMEEFCRNAGVSYESMRKKLKTSRTVGIDLLLKLNKAYPKVNLHWLLTGEGGRIINDDDSEVKNLKNELMETQRELIKCMKKGTGG